MNACAGKFFPRAKLFTCTSNFSVLYSATYLLFTAREARTLDAMFVVDQSGSIGGANFQLVREFCINLTKSFDIEKSKTQIGVLGFSYDASIVIPLGQYSTTSALVQAISSIPYPGGSTNTASALTLLPTAFTSARTSSQGIPKVAFVITDGQSDDPVATANAANILHSSYSSITVYGVGVGGGISTTELGIIASDKSKVYDLSSFSTSQFQDLQISTYTDSFSGKILRATGGYRP